MKRLAVILAAALGAAWLATLLSEPVPAGYRPESGGPPRRIR